MTYDWWQQTLDAVARRDYPAAKRAALSGVSQQQDSQPWLALAAVLRAMGDLRGAWDALEHSFVRHEFHRIPAGTPDAPRVLMLTPLHLASLTLMPDGRFSSGGAVDWGAFLDGVVHQEFVTVELLERHPERLEELRRRNDLVVNLITDPDAVRESLSVATKVVDALGLPVVNHPARVLRCGRADNFRRFSGIPGIEFPVTLDIDLPPQRIAALGKVREVAEGIGYPFLLRRSGWHDGAFMHKIDHPDEIDALNLTPGGGTHTVIQFRDLAQDDGLYRKARFYCVDGVWYPRSLNAAKQWNVHFAGHWELLQTPDAARLEAEEFEFLKHWRDRIGPLGESALAQVAEVVGLDWFGIDFALLPDGKLFVFEVNPAMRLKGSGLAPVRNRALLLRPFVDSIVEATRQLVHNRAHNGLQ